MRIEIQIEDSISSITALKCLQDVIKHGRISNNGKSYCYVSVIPTKEGEILVQTRQYRKNDCFLITKQRR
jgi:hypothetical protein